MPLRTFEPWPRAEFGADEREIIVARDTPPGMGRPSCFVCGGPVTVVVHVHHVLPRGMGGHGGDGRPSNGIVVHAEHQDPGCHITRIHSQPVQARASGWLRSKHAPRPAVYAQPVQCAWRGVVVLLDEPDEVTGLYWRPAAASG